MFTVLIASGDADALLARASTLRRAGFEVLEVSNGADALRIAGEQPGISALMLDAALPDCQGADVARKLRGSSPTRDIPIVLVAPGSAGPEEIASALEYVDGFLTEPLHPAILVARVRALSRACELRGRLLQSEARYRTLFENMTEEVQVWRIRRDDQGRMNSWTLSDANPSALRTWGRTLDEIQGKTADEIFGPGTAAHYLPVIEKIVRDGVPYSYEDYLPVLDKYFRFTSFPLGDYVITTGAEITELRQAERELRRAHQRLEALMKAVPVGVSFSHDPTCQNITGNPTVLALFEMTDADNLSASAPDPAAPGRQIQFFRDGRLMTGADLPLQRAVAEKREIPPMELEVHLPSGRGWFAECSAAPILDRQGNVIGGVAVSVDITERKRREDELRELVQRLTYHVDHSPLAVIEFGADMRLVRWSGAAERVFGWKAEQVIGKRMEDFRWIYEDDQAQVARVAAELRTGSNPHRFSANRNYRKDGSVVHCEWYNSSLLDSSGKLRSILSLVLDVTERKQAEDALRESRDWLALAQRIADAGSFDVNLKTNMVVWSEELQRIYGIGPGQTNVRMEDWVEWVVPEDRDRVMADFAAGMKFGDVVTQFRIRRRDTGEIRWIEGRGRTIRDENGNPVKMVGFSIDISQQKRSEDEIQRAAESYRRSNEQLQQFTYVVSHDLQEPLRNISSFSALLEQRLQGSLDPQTIELLGFVRDGALRMRTLVNDLLAYSRVELEEHDVAIVDMRAALYLALDNLKRAIESSEAEVTFDPLPFVEGDFGRLVQLLQNLVGNAIKYRGDRKPCIHISALSGEDCCTFMVRDNGIGIDPQYNERIFGIFKRLHSAREYPGTGIGLAICRKIVDRHGGRIWVESERGKGSTFFFTLRAAKEQHANSVATD